MAKFSIDIGIIGAGLAGLTCARALQRAGFSVTLFDKSRGIGGRVATRRIPRDDREIRVDHGLPYLSLQGERTGILIEEFLQKGIIEPRGENFYTSPDGMNAIAKFLAADLDIRRDYLVTGVKVIENHWSIEGKDREAVAVNALVVAIPAPQAADVFQASDLDTFLPVLRSISYDPCITVIVGYPEPPSIPENPNDTRAIVPNGNAPTVFVLHSSPEFASENIDRPDLEIVKQELLARSGLPTPEWSQIHRWRYAFPRQNAGLPYLSSRDPLPLVFCGDWCLGTGERDAVEAALTSGSEAAKEIERYLQL